LYVVFTMDCPPRGTQALPHGPDSWEASARSIDAFCTVLLAARFVPTLFLTPEAADAHAPLAEDLAGAGVEMGLLIQPPSLHGAGYKRYLGAYGREQQHEIVSQAAGSFAGALGRRPQSARAAMFSASDDTFAVLCAAGFRQASISSPGRRTPKYHAVWADAAPDAHAASATNRLECGSLPLLEVPVTTDATQRRGGLSPDLAIENGTVARWHAPLIAGQLQRHEAQDVAFRTLCFVTSSRIAYADPATRPRQTLDELLDHLAALDERYEVIPASLAETYAYFRGAHPL
jgi:hypothetical protein